MPGGQERPWRDLEAIERDSAWYEEQLRYIDVSRTEPYLLASLIENAQELGAEVARDEDSFVRRTEELVDELIAQNWIMRVENAHISRARAYLEKPLASVDGSQYLGGWLHGKYFIPITAVRIMFRSFWDRRPVVVFSEGTKIYEFMEIDHRLAEVKAELKMLGLEAELLKEAVDDGVQMVMVDGPIVDPPRPLRIAGRDYDEYVRMRARVLRKAVEKGVLVIGLVKRVTGNMFIGAIAQDGIQPPYFMRRLRWGDRILLDAMLTSLLMRDKDGLYRTRHFEPLSEHIGAYDDYKSAGLKVLTFFTQARVDTPPVRVEVLPAEEDLIPLVAALVKLTTLPGQPYPMPIMMAHEKSLIRKGLAETLFYEIITQSERGQRPKLIRMLRLKYLMG